MNSTATTIRRTAGVAALILGVQVTAACGTEPAGTDIHDPGTTTAKVQRVGSADAIERRALATTGNPHGSADALERRLATERGGACLISAEAAERLGHAACVD